GGVVRPPADGRRLQKEGSSCVAQKQTAGCGKAEGGKRSRGARIGLLVISEDELPIRPPRTVEPTPSEWEGGRFGRPLSTESCIRAAPFAARRRPPTSPLCPRRSGIAGA